MTEPSTAGVGARMLDSKTRCPGRVEHSVPRRIAAVVAPFLACEVVRRREPIAGPLAVIVDRDGVGKPLGRDGVGKPLGRDGVGKPLGRDGVGKPLGRDGVGKPLGRDGVGKPLGRDGVGQPLGRDGVGKPLGRDGVGKPLGRDGVGKPLGRDGVGKPLLDREAPERPATEPLNVVDEAARRFGVRPGQQAAEACALASRLAVRHLAPSELAAALGAVAEMTMALGMTAAIEALNTVWVDVTGAAHLVGGEEVLADELAERASALGHRVRVAIADGPRIAQAVARFAKEPCTVVPVGQGAQALAPLPVHALPVGADVASFLVRVGVFSVGELAQLPRASVAARLGSERGKAASGLDKSGKLSLGPAERAREAIELAQGRDPMPLVPWEAPRRLEEIVCFEESTPSSEALLFVLRGMLGRVAARLTARGEAAGRVEIGIALDRSIAALREVEPTVELAVDLPAPLCAESDLLRALKGKIERTELAAPAVALRLCVPEVVRARRVQLDLSRRRTASPDALPALLAELSAEIGADRLGVLRIADSHRPEACSELVPAALSLSTRGGSPTPSSTKRGTPIPSEPSGPEPPTRLLPVPAPLGPVVPGAVVVVGTQLYTVERMRFVQRIDGIEWWTAHPARRDYFRAWLTAPSSKAEAWIYVDRSTGDAYLQGFCE